MIKNTKLEEIREVLLTIHACKYYKNSKICEYIKEIKSKSKSTLIFEIFKYMNIIKNNKDFVKGLCLDDEVIFNEYWNGKEKDMSDDIRKSHYKTYIRLINQKLDYDINIKDYNVIDNIFARYNIYNKIYMIEDKI